MKYEIGDKIIVLHSDEEGKVVEIINDKMVLIEVRGVRFPAYMDQIDFPYYKMFTQKKVIEKKKIFIDQIKKEKINIQEKIADGVFLNIIPVFDKDFFDDDIVDKLKIYLVNYNKEDYHFTYKLVFAGDAHFELKSTINSLQNFYLHNINFEDVSDSPSFDFEFSLVNQQKGKSPFFERSLKLKGKQIFKRIEEMSQKNESSFSYELFIDYPDKIEESKIDLSKLNNAGFRLYEISKAKDHLPSAQSVVDLHIEKLMNNHHHLQTSEILSIQLNAFEKHLELAILHLRSSIVFIHGIGEGTLRDEIHQRLKNVKKVNYFVNQYHPLYGYGATEVFFN